MTSRLIGRYSDKNKLKLAVQKFKDAGFDNSDISIVIPSQDATDEFSHDMATKIFPGAVYGIILGSCFGLGIGWVFGNSTLFSQSNRPFYLHGPLGFTLGFTAVCAFIFMFVGGMLGMLINEYRSRRLWVTNHQEISAPHRSNALLLEIDVDDSQVMQARTIMNVTDVESIKEFEKSAEPKTSVYQSIEKEFEDFRKVRALERERYI